MKIKWLVRTRLDCFLFCSCNPFLCLSPLHVILSTHTHTHTHTHIHTHTRMSSLHNCTSWVPQTGAAVNSHILGEELSSSLWWAEN